MGLCTSREKPAAPPSVPGRKKTSAWTTHWKEEKWHEDIRDIWGRKLEDLPVHMDLPRLAKNINLLSAHDADGNPNPTGELVDVLAFFKTGPNVDNQREMVKEIILCVAREVQESQFQIVEWNSSFWEHVKREDRGDLSQQLLSFLVNEMGDTRKAVRVMKACHQKMIFPAFYSIKNAFGGSLPFKDQRGTWRVTIYFFVNTILLVHKKTQVAVPADGLADGVADFEFDWELWIRIPKDCSTILRSHVVLRELRVADSVNGKRKREITAAIETHYQIGEESVVDLNLEEIARLKSAFASKAEMPEEEGA